MADMLPDDALSSETLGNSIRVASATAFNAIASGVATIIVARALGTTEYGQFAYWLFFVGLVGGLSDLGVNTRGVNVLVRAWPRGDTATVASELRLLLRVGVVRAVVVGLVSAAILREDPTAALVIGV